MKKATSVETAANMTEQRFSHRQPEILGVISQMGQRRDRFLAVSIVGNVLLIALAIVLAGRPVDVVMVDKLGAATWYHEAASPEVPQEFEADAFAATWLRDFLSRDAITAKDDIARALSLTHPDLQGKLRAQFAKTDELAQVRNAFVHSSVKVTSSTVTRSAKDRYLVQVKGERMLMPIGITKDGLKEPFAYELVLNMVPRGKATPNGLMVRYITGGLADEAKL